VSRVETPKLVFDLEGTALDDGRSCFDGARDTVELDSEALDFDLVVLATEG
jgi:hypothetical protein